MQQRDLRAIWPTGMRHVPPFDFVSLGQVGLMQLHSHAREFDVPGTVDLNTFEGDDTGYGQGLFPVPADDPDDPLQWPEWKRSTILLICAFYSFIGNAALIGPSVYIGIYAEEFQISPTVASGLVSYCNLAYGFGKY